MERNNDTDKNIIGKYIFPLISGVFLVAFSFLAASFFGGATSFAFALTLGGLIYILDKNIRVKAEISKSAYIISLLTSLAFSYPLIFMFRTLNPESPEWRIYCSYLVFSLTINYFFTLFTNHYINLIKKRGNELFSLILPSLTLIAFLLIYMPTLMIMGNNDDYLISYWDFIKPHLILLALLAYVFTYILVQIPGRAGIVISLLVNSLLTGAYLQYMFLNYKLPILNGSRFEMADCIPDTIINIFIWLLILGIMIYFVLVKKQTKVCFYSSLIINVLLFIAFLTSIITAPKAAFKLNYYFVDNSKQYAFAYDENVIFFIIDAADNLYIKNIYEREPQIFDYYKDFTIYTNTCSVFDLTLTSMPQMLTGASYDDYSVDFDGFYQRLKDNNFAINAYNYHYEKKSKNIMKYMDNYTKSDSMINDYSVDNPGIIKNSIELCLYITAPYIVKNYIDPSEINFTSQITYNIEDVIKNMEDEKSTNYSNYANYMFADNMDVTVDDEMEKAFILQHIDGAHGPLVDDDYEGKMIECLDILERYIDGLKENGLYDKATIIVTSDHGLHDGIKPYKYPMAGTPILMVKEPFAERDSIVFNDAPVYHTDFLKTILVNTGLYNEEDGDRFGYSIYDFNEGDSRERSWYDTDGKDYLKFTYTGDTKALEEMVDNGIYEKIIID